MFVRDQLRRLPTVCRYIGSHDANTSITTYYAIPYAYASRFELAKPIETEPGISANQLVDASTHGPSCINFNLPPVRTWTGKSLLRFADTVAPTARQVLRLKHSATWPADPLPIHISHTIKDSRSF